MRKRRAGDWGGGRVAISLSFLLFVLVGCSNPEKNNDTRIIELTDTTTIKVDASLLLGCGASGKVSEQLDSTKNLVLAKDYKAIAANLHSTDLVTQIISVVALETLSENKLLAISENDRQLIFQIKRSQKICSVCHGCTDHFNGRVVDIFYGEKSADIISGIKFKCGIGEY